MNHFIFKNVRFLRDQCLVPTPFSQIAIIP